jgi:hypothetical protein
MLGQRWGFIGFGKHANTLVDQAKCCLPDDKMVADANFEDLLSQSFVEDRIACIDVSRDLKASTVPCQADMVARNTVIPWNRPSNRGSAKHNGLLC